MHFWASELHPCAGGEAHPDPTPRGQKLLHLAPFRPHPMYPPSGYEYVYTLCNKLVNVSRVSPPELCEPFWQTVEPKEGRGGSPDV